MVFRFRTLACPALLAAACTTSAPSPTPGPAGARPTPPAEQAAVALGLTVMSSNASGAPRLLRSITPRPVVAGLAPQAAARDHIAALAPLWVHQAPPMALADRGTQRLRNGATVARLAQHVDGVVVDRGELRVLMHPDGSLAAVSGTLLPTIDPTFVSSPREAVERALDLQYTTARARPVITDAGERGGWQTLTVGAAPQLHVTSARARRLLAETGGRLGEAWEIEIVGDATPAAPELAAVRYVLADADGALLRKTDLIQSDAFVYRAFAEPTGNRRPLDGVHQGVSPHPTGVPDGSAPGFTSANLIVMDSFNGPRDRWLPDDATTTAGNNAEAFADPDGTRSFTDGDIRPEVRAGRVLNDVYDPEAEPLASPDQAKAATVNAFFVVNWMHDWYYDSGFTEATGNAQLDNYGRGGIDGDRLQVFAQSAATVGDRNNGFMTTPADGLSPQMRLQLWTPASQGAVITPHGTLHTDAFAVGPHRFELTAQLVVGDVVNHDGCAPIADDLTGKIALILSSGNCLAADSLDHAKAAGAVGVVYANWSDGPQFFTGSAAANLPALILRKTDGDALAAALGDGPLTVTLQSVSAPERDSALDNTIVAHEWGHYLHHRLAVCDSQPCRGMSEGWGDFNALLMMLREGDDRDGTYAVGPYAISEAIPDAAYFGIRRFPYSRDRAKNALSFRHIGTDAELPTTTPGNLDDIPNSEEHNSGEVWATMLWEALNVLVDEHGVTVARRRMTDYAVAGLLLTPPEATFTEARDAILAAASALDTDDMLLIAAAFAGRGAGTCAISPPVNAPGNEGVIESGTLSARLQVGRAALVDSGVSCDHDGYLDPGETGVVRIAIANAGSVAAEDVTITATTTSPGLQIGAPVRVPVLAAFSRIEIGVPVAMPPSAPRNALVSLTLHVSGDDTCDPAGTTVALSARTGADDLPDTARIDHVETLATPWTTAGAEFWHTAIDASGNQSWFAESAAFTADAQLVSPPLQVSATEPFVVALSHAYDLEAVPPFFLLDGAVIELSTDGGATWNDVSAFGVDPHYTALVLPFARNPLAERLAFGGRSPNFPALIPLTLDFGTQLAGHTVQLRFRVGTDTQGAATGWTIDDIAVSGIVNTPFPTLTVEPSICTARTATDHSPTAADGVIATYAAPRTSLREFDAAVCIEQ